MGKENSRNASMLQDGSDQGLLLEVGVHRLLSVKMGLDFVNTVKDDCTIRPTVFVVNGRMGSDGVRTLGKQYDFVPGLASEDGVRLHTDSGKALIQPSMDSMESFVLAIPAAIAGVCYWQAKENCPPDTKWTVHFRALMLRAGMVVDPAASESDRKNLKRWIASDPDAVTEACEYAHLSTGVEVWPTEGMSDDAELKPKARYVYATCPKHIKGLKTRIVWPEGEERPTRAMQKDDVSKSEAALVCPQDGLEFKVLKEKVKADVAALEATIALLTAKLSEKEETEARAA